MLRSSLYIVIGCLFAVFSAGAQEDWSQKVDPLVLSSVENGKTADFLVVFRTQADLSDADRLYAKEEKGQLVFDRLRQTAARTQAAALNIIGQAGVHFRTFYIYNAILVKGDLALLIKLASLESVARIQPDIQMRYHEPVERLESPERGPLGTEWGIRMIGADSVWQLGFRGQGVVIGGQDTGYDWTHPAIKKKYRGWNEKDSSATHNYNWHDAIRENNPNFPDSVKNPCGLGLLIPCDDNSHGTHTMGTMAGNDGQGNEIGVAPEARWIGARNMDRGWGKLSTYLECFEWFLAPTDLDGKNPRPDKAPHVINNSWYCSTDEGCNPANWSPLDTAVSALRRAGVVVVVSAGNSGPGCGSITGPPALFNSSFSIGATNQVDTIARFSSRGLVTIDGSNRMKPNVSAPGVGVRSSIPGGRYASFSGTSMAGPHVAGAVALIISANPKLAGQVAVIEQILQETAVRKRDTTTCGNVAGTEIPNPIYGFGRIDVYAAVKKALVITATGELAVQPDLARVYPNPASSTVHFELLRESGDVRLSLFDLTGRLVTSAGWQGGNGTTFTLDLSALPEGLYTYRLQSGTVRQTGKLAKAHQ